MIYLSIISSLLNGDLTPIKFGAGNHQVIDFHANNGIIEPERSVLLKTFYFILQHRVDNIQAHLLKGG